ncbi:MAG: tandem-95 repeat protein, partial [Thiotrichales bacterium]
GGAYGVVTLNAAGVWDYAANTNQAAIQGLAAGATLTDTITISSADGTTHDIVITIMGTNDAPVAGNDVANVDEGGSVLIDVAATDTDIDDALDLNSIVITSLPANGTVVVNGDGTVTYNHNGSETLSDSFSYTISDISGAVSNSATVSLSVNPVNDPPVAGDDAAIVAEGNTILIDLAANDMDVDSALDLNSISIIGAPANGSLIVNGDGTVTYSHNGSETTSDSFTYTIADISGAISNTATVNIAVTPVNDAPTTGGIAAATVNEDAANTTVNLNAAFDDADNLDSELNYSIVGNTNIGLFSAIGIDNSTGRLTLDYGADMNGSAQITIRAADPAGLSVDTLFSVTVIPVNDAPVLQTNAGLQAATGSAAVISSNELNASDIDNTSMQIIYTVTSLPSDGALMLNGTAMTVNDSFTQDDLDNNRLVYLPAGTSAADQFAFTVSDSAGAMLNSNTFNIVVQLTSTNNSSSSVTPSDTTSTPEDIQQEAATDSSGASEQGGGYGGGYIPFGGTSVPQDKPALSIERTPLPEAEKTEFRPVMEMKDDIMPEVEEFELGTFTEVQVKSMDALWGAIDEMKQEVTESAEEKIAEVEFRVAAAKSSGVVLTAGVVAWILRSGALLSSLLSTMPLWKGYDPLPILAYKDDDEKEDEMHEDKIPTSLKELKKLKNIKHKKAKENEVDSIFGGSIIRE